ncbi:MAG: phage baseplate assembly protein V [Rhodospirillaceae bacterium]|nr:phage baseplate assembly protein V [Rhodospirillales bacterium]
MSDPGFQLSQILQWMANLIRFGVVDAVGQDGEHASVSFAPGQSTAMLPVFATSAGHARHHNPIKAGEQVAVLSPNGELGGGAILRGLHSAANPQPSDSLTADVLTYPDGTTISYDWAAHRLVVDALAAEGTLVLQAKNLVLRIGDGGYFHTDHAGRATRVTHKGGNVFESEGWTTGSSVTGLPDHGFTPPRVNSPAEGGA